MTTRTLPSSLSTGLSAAVTSPGFLVEFGYTPPVRFSTAGAVTWNGNVFADAPLAISGLAQAANGSAAVTLEFSDLDNTVGSIILASRIANVPITIWVFDRLVFGASDALPLYFSGYGEAATGDDAKVRVTAIAMSAKTLVCPRRNITKALGFSRIPPAGTVIVWNGERYQLKGANS